jgi:hypothetical protein
MTSKKVIKIIPTDSDSVKLISNIVGLKCCHSCFSEDIFYLHNKLVYYNYYPNGKIHYVEDYHSGFIYENYDTIGLITNKFQEYYQNGMIKQNGILDHKQRKTGTWNQYDKNGCLIKTEYYDANTLDSVSYYKNDTIIFTYHKKILNGYKELYVPKNYNKNTYVVNETNHTKIFYVNDNKVDSIDYMLNNILVLRYYIYVDEIGTEIFIPVIAYDIDNNCIFKRGNGYINIYNFEVEKPYIIFRHTYKNHKLTLIESFYANSVVLSEKIYINKEDYIFDFLHHRSVYFFLKQVDSVIIYFKNGNIEFKYNKFNKYFEATTFYLNGIINEKIIYNFKTKKCIYTNYYPSGSLKVKGTKTKTEKILSESNSVTIITEYFKNIDKWVYYNTDGKIIKQEYFK